jgi:hypothetical protein
MKYIVNKNAQANGDHEVHKWPESLCSSPRYPMSENQLHLGEYVGCTGAVQEAKKEDIQQQTDVIIVRPLAIQDKVEKLIESITK